MRSNLCVFCFCFFVLFTSKTLITFETRINSVQIVFNLKCASGRSCVVQLVLASVRSAAAHLNLAEFNLSQLSAECQAGPTRTSLIVHPWTVRRRAYRLENEKVHRRRFFPTASLYSRSCASGESTRLKWQLPCSRAPLWFLLAAFRLREQSGGDSGARHTI